MSLLSHTGRRPLMRGSGGRGAASGRGLAEYTHVHVQEGMFCLLIRCCGVATLCSRLCSLSRFIAHSIVVPQNMIKQRWRNCGRLQSDPCSDCFSGIWASQWFKSSSQAQVLRWCNTCSTWPSFPFSWVSSHSPPPSLFTFFLSSPHSFTSLVKY